MEWIWITNSPRHEAEQIAKNWKSYRIRAPKASEECSSSEISKWGLVGLYVAQDEYNDNIDRLQRNQGNAKNRARHLMEAFRRRDEGRGSQDNEA